MDNICTSVDPGEENCYSKGNKEGEDADTILNEYDHNETKSGNDEEDDSDDSTDSGTGNKVKVHEDYEGYVPHPAMNTHVNDRITEEIGEDGTPVRHIQSIDSSSETSTRKQPASSVL
jgi:hypothetical protein